MAKRMMFESYRAQAVKARAIRDGRTRAGAARRRLDALEALYVAATERGSATAAKAYLRARRDQARSLPPVATAKGARPYDPAVVPSTR